MLFQVLLFFFALCNAQLSKRNLFIPPNVRNINALLDSPTIRHPIQQQRILPPMQPQRIQALPDGVHLLVPTVRAPPLNPADAIIRSPRIATPDAPRAVGNRDTTFA